MFDNNNGGLSNRELDRSKNLLCKLDLGVLGLLWCKGSPEDKADFFFDLSKLYNNKFGNFASNKSFMNQSTYSNVSNNSATK